MDNYILPPKLLDILAAIPNGEGNQIITPRDITDDINENNNFVYMKKKVENDTTDVTFVRFLFAFVVYTFNDDG